jgi:hypothetical protein
MANYLLLYSGGSMPQTETEQKAVMAEWETWFKNIGGALVDGGNPFTPQAKTITADGKVSDGSGGPMPSGYTILKANSLNEAVELAKGSPVLKGGAAVMVFETFEAMGG